MPNDDSMRDALVGVLEEATAREKARVNAIIATIPANAPKPKERSRGRDGVFVKNHKFWISFTDAQGRRNMQPTNAPTLQQARAIRAQELWKVEKQRRFGHLEPTEEMFSDVVQNYLDYQRARISPGSYWRAQGIIEQHIKPYFGTMKLAQVKKRHVEDYITKQRNGGLGASSVRKELNVLKHMFSFYVEQELLEFNPASGVKGPKAPQARLRYLQPAELAAVLKACPPWLQPIAGLLAFTGMRRSEVLNLRTMDVDLQNGCVTLQQTKNNKPHVVWLNRLARQVLIFSMRPGAKPTDCIFAGDNLRKENVSLAFLRTCRKCGIADFHLHDLRHTAASWMRQSGADLQDIQKVLGHSNIKMTDRYAHLSPKHLLSVVATLDAAFGPELKEIKMLEAAEA
jgi:integrase